MDALTGLFGEFDISSFLETLISLFSSLFSLIG